jgi:hypothetical protein
LSAAKQIDKKIASLGDWRGPKMTELRNLINEADSSLKEEWKWGTPVWTKNGLVVSVGAFKDHVKVNFFKGRLLKDPKGVINAGLDAKETRAIDVHQGDKLDSQALKALVREASRLNSTN